MERPMFITLLGVTFAIAVVVSFIVVQIFRRPIVNILDRVVTEELSHVWLKYLTFALYVVGVSGGVRVWDLEKYITPRTEETEIIVLNAERWVLEVYRTGIGTLQAVAWMLLVFFVFALIAYVIVKGMEGRRATPQ